MNQREQGYYRKFNVSRVDGRDQPGGDRHGAKYLVLDMTFDPPSQVAALAYATAIEATHPALAADIRFWVNQSRLGGWLKAGGCQV